LLNVIIVGAGYAGLNAYYELKRRGINAEILSSSDEFEIKNAWLRSKILRKKVTTSFILPKFVNRCKVKDIDISSRTVYTDDGRLDADKLIIAMGAQRKNLDGFVESLLTAERINLAPASKYDEYIAIQIALYLNAIGKSVSYSGGYLDWLGERIGRRVRMLIESEGIKQAEKAEQVLPPPEPPYPLASYLKVDEFLSVADGVYAAGDVADIGPKLGELAMRMGIYAASRMTGNTKPFRPVFINIIDTGRGKGMHIRSDLPWKGNIQSVKISRLRYIMKRFLERYYVYRKGKMGFLVNF
jgi:NADH dehydrogenase FAD-containing subunit